jgi:7,8-dihydropterin-6-yl-methyl-4-(beta-D-ribofuranosyl)aminobenzene 5'-phosphate synthase
MPPEGIFPLDELQLLVIVDNETDTLSTVDDGIPVLPEMAHLVLRTPVSRTYEGGDGKETFDKLCCACHGLSVLVTGRRDDRTATLLFDVGPFPDVWLDNAAKLDVDLASIDVIFLSHWHFDHSGGLPQVVEAVSEARSRAGKAPVVVDVHPDRPDQRGVRLPDGLMVLLPPEPSIEAIEAAGATVVQHADPHPLCDGFFHASGQIERVTDYETGLVGHHSFYGERVEPDPLILDERYVAAELPGRGITVLSACSHAGVVNACLDARQEFPGQPVDVVLGGFHLAGRGMEERITATVADLQDRIEPRLVSPGHCTGWRAKAALAQAFAPGRYAPSVVGSLYLLSAGAPADALR